MSRPNGSRGTRAEKDRRIHKVCQMMLRGLDNEAIFLAAQQLGWDVSRRSVQTYIAAARERIEEAAAEQRSFLIGQALARYGMVFGEAFKDRNWRAAISAEGAVVDLLGLRSSVRGEDALTGVEEYLAAQKGEPPS